MYRDNVHIAQDELSADSKYVQKLVYSPWPSSLRPRDKAELKPLKICYIAIAECFASFRKRGLQFITPYLFWLLKAWLRHILLKVRPVLPKAW